ncbi:hypothetical protein [Kitasatospora sp. MAP5-34]|uniref:hypothetical protein n=1 Tax=Kitasatospora sp. MAP5-34 TaxID=3035102 RepID=UPI0024757824|nr:hypothetical protein [Kitasatospora sp. MAP5-34]MDH6578955.1 hypothetical protein [Kitasatospora sp. MAP5-34]
MSTNRSRRIDQATAEQLLGGAVVGTSAGQAPVAGRTALAGLLAAATAAPVAGDGELPGEQAALTAFREARRTPVAETRRRTMAGAAPTRAFSVKALIAAFAIAAFGGVAVAAGTGSLPAVLGGRPASETTPAAKAPASSPTGTLSGRSGVGRAPGSGDPDDPGGTTSGRGATSTPQPSGSGAARSSAGPERPGSSDGPGQDSPGHDEQGKNNPGRSDGPSREQTTSQLLKLCQALSEREAAGAKARSLLGEPQLAPLVGAAGGVDQVDAFCKTVVARAGQGGGEGGGQGGDHGGGQGNDPTGTPLPGRVRSDPPGGMTALDGELPGTLGRVGLPGPPGLPGLAGQLGLVGGVAVH